MFRQSTLQQQQTVSTVPSTLSVQPFSSTPTPAQKLSLPSGIEQLRATVASAASVLPRFPSIATNSGSTVKSLPSGRTLPAEEVLALIKQQSIRMAATQSSQLAPKSSQVSSHQAGLKTVSTCATGVSSQQSITSTVAQNFKAQIQALATQHKSSITQTKISSEKKN